MITRFKIFESPILTKKKYWVIPLDDYFYIRLVIKLGLSFDQVEEIYKIYLDLHDDHQINHEFVFFFVAFDENGKFYGWKFYEALDKNIENIYSEDFSHSGFIKQPNIEITQEDIDKWEMLMDTEKYNL